MSEAQGEKVLISYNSPNRGKHPVRGMRTKEYYGYRRRGDQFMVYESDMRTRPDLFVAIGPVDKPDKPPSTPSHRGRPQEMANVLGARAVAEAVQAPPAPPSEMVEVDTVPNEPDPYELPSPLEMRPETEDGMALILSEIDWSGTKVNKRHLSLLKMSDIKTLGDLIPLTEDNVLAIKGIGEAVTRALFSKLKEHNI